MDFPSTAVKISGRDHIHPVDHTTYDGESDLSADMYFAHDGKNLYFAADVTDDRHFNKFPISRIWSGDSIQIGIDPETNFLRNENDLDPDDSFLSLGLQTTGQALKVHRGPFRTALEEGIEYKITRNEKTKKTLYRLKMPRAFVATKLKSGDIFGFNCIVFDDDSNAGADYWLFLRQGLAGGLRPDKFAPCIIE